MKSRSSSERRRWRSDVKYFRRELLQREEVCTYMSYAYSMYMYRNALDSTHSWVKCQCTTFQTVTSVASV